MGADYRGLGVVRSLGRCGIPVWVLRHHDQLLGACSRYAQRCTAWRGAREEDRLRSLLELADRNDLDGWVLFPTDDETVLLVARHHAALAKRFRLTTPPWERLRPAVDKHLLLGVARDAGVDSPWTYCARDREELRTLDCPFPVIVKPAFREAANQLTSAKAWRADDRAALLSRFDEACRIVGPEQIMIQEFIPGGSRCQLSYAALCVDGQPRATVVARRSRQFPVDIGRASTHVETTHDEDVVVFSERLLKALQFTGIVEIEYKRDPRDGRCKVLDVNPRVWGWHSVCSAAGVDFPQLAWRLALGEAIPEQHGRAGVRWVRMTTDVLASAHEIALGHLSLAAYVLSLRGPIESAIFAVDDPMPGLLEIPLMAYLIGKRLLGRRRL
jgi:predicted ATP-grasp superfamily ATP-dependent carboligase